MRFKRAAKIVRWVERVIGWAGMEGDAETWKKAIKRWWPHAVDLLVLTLSGLGAWIVGNPLAAFFFVSAGVLLAVRVGELLVRWRRSRVRDRDGAKQLPTTVSEIPKQVQATTPPPTKSWLTELQALRILERSAWIEAFRPEGDTDHLEGIDLHKWKSGHRVTQGDQINP